MTGLLPMSKLLSFTTIQGFLKRYKTPFWVNWIKAVSQRGQIYMHDPVNQVLHIPLGISLLSSSRVIPPIAQSFSFTFKRQ